MTQKTSRCAVDPAACNATTPAVAEPGFHRACVSADVWSALLSLKGGRAVAPSRVWSREENAAWALYAPLAAPPPHPLVFAQIGQSLDGRIATESGDARNVSGRDGLMHLHRCRALADAVVVGVNTVLADNPRLTVRLVDGADPARVVIDPRGRLPDECDIFDQPGRKFVIQGCDRRRPHGAEAIRLNVAEEGFDAHAIVAALSERGFRRILIEGGGITIGRFLDAGALHRLHVGISPMLIGAGPPGLIAAPVSALSEALRPRVDVYGLGTDVIFDCRMERPTCP